MNNFYVVVFECGVCGGVVGGFNVRVFVILCNFLEVREVLFVEGIKIFKDIIFVVVEYKIIVDELEWIYVLEFLEIV